MKGRVARVVRTKSVGYCIFGALSASFDSNLQERMNDFSQVFLRPQRYQLEKLMGL